MASLFPYDEVRPMQDVLTDTIEDCTEQKRNVVAHAPTGLGKTAASLAATLSNNLDTDKTVVFLTSMHTQHQIALDTIRDIREKHGVKIVGVDVVGKKHLCLQKGVKTLSSTDFAEYCRTLREDGACSYYNNLRRGEKRTMKSKAALSELKNTSPTSRQNLLTTGDKYDVCPYEISLFLGQESNVIVTDYYYLYHPGIRDTFLAKIDKDLSDLIVIVDEAHNLPDRVKDLASQRFSNYQINNAVQEANEHGYNDLQHIFHELLDILNTYAESHGDETYIKRKDFMRRVNKVWDYTALVSTLDEVADEIREEEKKSYIGGIADFLDAWRTNSSGYTRILEKNFNRKNPYINLQLSCLDPAVVTKPVNEAVHNTVLMSGTLNPPEMYRDLIGLPKDNTELLELKTPFPKENKLNLIVPKTSTKYKKRNESMYRDIGETIAKASNRVPGNVAAFLPSYALVNNIKPYLSKSKKTLFVEERGMSTESKQDMLRQFKSYKDTGALLLGVSSGNFAEGIDLPGDLLKAVIVVGLPLARPDLETKAMINYYDEKFGKGWDYGYIYPAFNKILQSAGRCIRSETDKGAIMFLDERYAWNNYKKCFPSTWNLRTTQLYEKALSEFFGTQQATQQTLR